MQRCTCRQAPASTRLKWMSHRKTLLACVLTRACVLLSFVHALACRVAKNLLKHHKKFTMAILYKGPAIINLVDVIRNHTRLLQESWPDSSRKDCDEISRVGTKIYRNKWVIPDNIGFASGIHFIPRAIGMIWNCGRLLAFLWSLNFGLIKAKIKVHVQSNSFTQQ